MQIGYTIATMKKNKHKEQKFKENKAQKSNTGLTSGIMPFVTRVLIRPFTKAELEKKNSFGIILPDSSAKEKSEQGRVLAVGSGEYKDGKLIAPRVKVGDKVVFSKYGYDDVTVGEEELYLIKEENILAKLK